MNALGLLGISTTAIVVILVCQNIVFSIASALLAKEWRNRNSISWFFLSVFYGPVSLLFLACSKRLEIGESDSLATGLWAFLFIPLLIIAIFIGLVI